MFYLAAVVVADDRYDIEPDFERQAGHSDVSVGGIDQMPYFPVVDGILRHPEYICLTGFYLYNDQRCFPGSDNVYFVPAASPVGFPNVVPVFGKIFGGNLLPCFSQYIMFGHMMSSNSTKI